MTGGSQEKPRLFVTTTQIKEICLLSVVGCQDPQARAWPQGGVGLSRALLGSSVPTSPRSPPRVPPAPCQPLRSAPPLLLLQPAPGVGFAALESFSSLLLHTQNCSGTTWSVPRTRLCCCLVAAVFKIRRGEQEKQVTVAAEPTDPVADFFFGNNLGCGS